MLFFLVFILGIYTMTSVKNRAQAESLTEVKNIYKQDADSIYNSKIASKDEVIPIYTKEQLDAVGSEKKFEINGKIYVFGEGTSISAANYIIEVPIYVSANYEVPSLNYGVVDENHNLIRDKIGITITEAINKGKIQLGDYINYEIGTGSGTTDGSYTMTTAQTGYTSAQTYDVKKYAGKWQVLYCDSTNGLQIISSDNILANETSKEFYLQAENGYNNLIETLNTMAGKYVNTIYANSGRSVGSLPTDTQTSTGTTELYSNSYAWMATFGWNNKYKVGDLNYITDEKAMTSAGVKTISKEYWMASRSNGSTSSATTFYVRSMSTSGVLMINPLVNVLSTGTPQSVFRYFGVRPVVSIRYDILIQDSGETLNGKKVWNLIEP